MTLATLILNEVFAKGQRIPEWQAVLLCRIGEVIREEMAFELGLSA